MTSRKLDKTALIVVAYRFRIQDISNSPLGIVAGYYDTGFQCPSAIPPS